MTSARSNAHRALMHRRSPSSLKSMPDHKITFSTNPDRRPWWRAWIDYPNPTRDALVGVFGIVVVVIAFWFLTAR